MPKVKVYFDLICPYCYLGRGFWMKMQAERPVETEWTPWEIHPEAQPDGDPQPMERLKSMRENLPRLSDGIREFSPEPNHVAANSHNALLALEFARAQGKIDAYIERVYRAYFVEGVNISGIDEVVRLGAEAGLDGEKLRASIASREYENVLTRNDTDAEAMGLEVVPSFVQDGKLMLQGSTKMDFAEFREKYLAAWG